MKLYLVHNDEALENKIQTFIKENVPKIKFLSYNESFSDERQKALRVRGSFSAGLLPFAVLKTDDDKYIKAFYSEADDCTYMNLINNLLYYYGR